MNLTTLSSDSVQLHNDTPRLPESTKVRKDSGKGGLTDLDLGLKLDAARALASSGYYCKLNVSLSAIGGAGLSDVTDVDVLALNYDVAFRPTTIAISCKSGESKGLGLGREIFY